MDNSFELVDARPVRNISLSREACTDDQILRFGISAISRLDVPTSFICVELGFGDDCSKGSSFSQVQDSVTGIKLLTN